MKQTDYRFIWLALVVSISLSACFNKHGNFSYYKEKPILTEAVPLRTNGVFVIAKLEGQWVTDHFFFFKDGACLAPLWQRSLNDTFWSNPEPSLTYYKNRLKDFFPRGWGSFKIRKDSIYIQAFYNFSQSTIKRDVVEIRGVIKNDTTILITQSRCTWCRPVAPNPPKYNENGIQYFDKPIEYRFYPTDFKPDSSLAWFRKKKWYQEDLHESRR